MKKVVFYFILFFVFFSFTIQVRASEYSDVYLPEKFSDFHAEELSLYAKSAVLSDADTGRILYGKSANTPMSNASTTKILTCILALEKASLDDVVTVSDYACSMPKVKLGFSAGDTFYLRDLLYSLMLESHNDSAVAIAEHVAGSVEEFAKLMNEKAREIGCQNSHFVTPNGLDAEDAEGAHRTTAYDLSLIMAYCIQNEEFLNITRTQSMQIQTVDGTKSYSLSNHNALLQMMEGALSGKTGFTANAGYCYVGAYQAGGHTYTFTLLACGWPNNKNYKWSDSKQLIEYVDNMYSDRIVAEGVNTLEIPLQNAVSSIGGSIQYPEMITVRTSEETISGFISDSDEIQVEYDLPKAVAAPAKNGTVIGTEKIYLNHMLYAVRDVSLAESAENYDFSWCLDWLLRAFVS